MVQVLPYIPSPLEQLAPHIQQGAQALGQGIGNYQRNKSDAPILQQLQSGQVSPVEFNTLWSKLSPTAQKKHEPFLQSHLRTQEAESKEQSKRNTAKMEKQEKSNAVINTAQEMLDLLPYTGTTKNPLYLKSFNAVQGGLNRTGLEKREYFNELAAAGASFFRDLETKGQLPQGLYDKVIAPRLPNADLSERENKGRIEGLIALAKRYGGIEDEGKGAAPKADSKDLSEGQSFDKLPSASDYPKAIFKKGDKRYMSDGKKWTEI